MRYTIFFFFLFVVSCDSEDVKYIEETKLEEGVWTYDNELVYSFEINDTLSAYDMVLLVKHDLEYSFQNFYAEFTTTYPDKRSEKDLVSIELANQYGQWNGECSGQKCKTEILLSGATYFKQNGDYTLRLKQSTRKEKLEGLNSIGFKLIKIPSS